MGWKSIDVQSLLQEGQKGLLLRLAVRQGEQKMCPHTVDTRLPPSPVIVLKES